MEEMAVCVWAADAGALPLALHPFFPPSLPSEVSRN